MSPGRAGKHTVYHIGRVQTPTLAVVVEREESIRDFVKEPYYTVHILAEGSHSDPFMSDLASKSDTAPSGNRTEELDAGSDKYKSREEAVALADLCMGGGCQCR